MKRRFFHSLLVSCGSAALCVLVASAAASAQETFFPPQQHPMDRYEGGWKKNPFTLKTAPVVEEKKSFAKDLVLYNVNRVMGEVTVVLANSKTKELIRLKNSEPASNGMKIRSVMIQDTRKDSYVEVELNGESAVLRHDETFRKQMLASNAARGSRGAGDAASSRGREPTEPPAGENPTNKPAPAPAGAKGPTADVTAPAASRPPLPPSPTLAQAALAPANIRPGPGPVPPRTQALPPRGAPTRSARRFFTAPPSAPPPAPPSETP